MIGLVPPADFEQTFWANQQPNRYRENRALVEAGSKEPSLHGTRGDSLDELRRGPLALHSLTEQLVGQCVPEAVRRIDDSVGHLYFTPARTTTSMSTFVVQIGTGYWLRTPVGKLHTDRYVPLHPQLKDLLDQWVATRPDWQATSLLLTDRGRRIPPTRVDKAVQKAATAAGIGHVHPHQLRHTPRPSARASNGWLRPFSGGSGVAGCTQASSSSGKACQRRRRSRSCLVLRDGSAGTSASASRHCW